MNPLNFVSQHQVATILTLSAAASSLPPPTDNSRPFYKWLYKFSNTLTANVSAIRGKAQYEDAKSVPPA